MRQNTAGPRGTILVVDDDPAMRVLLRKCLTEWQVEEAADGQSGLERAQELVPDLVIVDWVMPRMTGLEVLQELRKRHETSKTPIFMLTKRDMMSDVMDATDAGADGYFTKPLKLTELTERLKSSLSIEASG